MHWLTTRFEIDLKRPRVMGIVNVTPDSFSDGGSHITADAALRHCERLLDEGADILDIGGESTRPGSPPVPLDVELQRLLPVLREAVTLGVPISVDTYKPEVMRAVLELAAEKAGWGQPAPAGRFRGVAVHKSFGTYVAQVAEVSLKDDGGVKVERVVCAVDCGIAVNPDIIRAQIEGGIGYGLGAILKGEITLEGGRVVQGNFDEYQVLTIDEMPKVEVHIVPSTEPPTGVGEPGTPPIGPAVANAVFAATGKRIRILPFSKTDLRTA